LPAFVGAALAFIGAPLAVVDIVLSTFHAAGFADLGTNAANLLHELRATTHEARRRPTDRRAVFVEPNTLGHHGDIAFTQASLGTVLAFLGASNASIDTRLVLLVGHGYLLNLKKEKDLSL
jgi:hypothetical protein